ncbi:hypothetical protein MPSYJ_09220 [Mycolicibacterium psychrotolerans]|uniref:NADH:ubiquinone oxidoreductase intermediate-associated protein 30 domain-containing protein n=1 Tax=Mycolicibacterium psychrotolerans TaxID=216929 RepID=A0A7I7M5J2_9MYCO|nr:hypothetical protein MPSYJ_09220 [Mycolicibacterium psychrotolerans]
MPIRVGADVFAVPRLPRALVGIMVACSTLLVVSCGSLEPSARAVPPDGRDVVLVDLGNPGEVATWTTVNDPVMGGRSTSAITFGNGGLVFSGVLSLENNGGFASARSPRDPDVGQRATGATSLRVRAVGDGKTYVLKAGDAGQPWSYIQRFTTEAGVQRTYDLPVAGFQPVGMRFDPAPDAPPTLDPSRIDQVSVYILDKQQGPFEITISGIDATV